MALFSSFYLAKRISSYELASHLRLMQVLRKSGCQAERYRLVAEGMKSLLGFLSVIAADLLRLTYLQRTQPETLAEEMLDSAQIQVLKAKYSRLPKTLTIAWCIFSRLRRGSNT